MSRLINLFGSEIQVDTFTATNLIMPYYSQKREGTVAYAGSQLAELIGNERMQFYVSSL
jgi:hypothetical protein